MGSGSFGDANKCAINNDIVEKKNKTEKEYKDLDNELQFMRQFCNSTNTGLVPLYYWKKSETNKEISIGMKAYKYSLKDYIEKYPNDGSDKKVDSILKIFEDIRAALTTLHNARYIHGDISPGNILVNVDDAGNVTDAVLIDFGSSRTYEEYSRDNQFSMTPNVAFTKKIKQNIALNDDYSFAFSTGLLFKYKLV